MGIFYRTAGKEHLDSDVVETVEHGHRYFLKIIVV